MDPAWDLAVAAHMRVAVGEAELRTDRVLEEALHILEEAVHTLEEAARMLEEEPAQVLGVEPAHALGAEPAADGLGEACHSPEVAFLQAAANHGQLRRAMPVLGRLQAAL